MNRHSALPCEDEARIDAQITGEREADCSDADYLAWLSEDPQRQAQDSLVREIWHDPQFANALEIVEEQLNNEAKRPPFSGVGVRYLAVAASLVIAILAVFIGRPEPDTGAPDYFYQTALQQVRQMPLTDGSIADLNAKTRLGVTFTVAERHLQLITGEARFSVAKDVSRPFVVETEQARMEALGTVFNVDQRGKVTELIVLEGRVSIRPIGNANERQVVSAGESVVVSTRRLSEVRRFDPADYEDWRLGWVKVENMPLAELLIKLNRYSPDALVAQDASTGSLLVTGTFKLDEIEKNIEILQALHNLQVRRQDSEIVFLSRS